MTCYIYTDGLYTYDAASFSSGNTTICMAYITTSYNVINYWGENSNFAPYVKKSSDGKTMYYYAPSAAYTPFNSTGVVYYYIALG